MHFNPNFAQSANRMMFRGQGPQKREPRILSKGHCSTEPKLSLGEPPKSVGFSGTNGQYNHQHKSEYPSTNSVAVYSY